MAVTFDNSTSAVGNFASTTTNFNLTIGGGQHICIVVYAAFSANGTVSAVTVNGQAATLQVQEDANTSACLEMWTYLISASSGATIPISVTITSTGGNGWMVGAMSFQGVDPTTPAPYNNKNQISNANTASTISQIAVNVAGNVIVDGICLQFPGTSNLSVKNSNQRLKLNAGSGGGSLVLGTSTDSLEGSGVKTVGYNFTTTATNAAYGLITLAPFAYSTLVPELSTLGVGF